MHLRKEADAIKHANAPTCVAYEYQLPTGEMDSAVIKLDGRYPVQGWALNTKCTAIVYVVKGKGRIISKTEEMPLEKGDEILIEKNEQYVLEGQLKLIFSATPAWSPDQAKIVQ